MKCRAGRPLCAESRKPHLCHCSGVVWSSSDQEHDQARARAAKDEQPKNRNPPHRRGSKCGKFGICEHHPQHAAGMWALVDEPVRRRA